jgi:hypothetical protein
LRLLVPSSSQSALGEVVPGIEISWILMGQWIHTFSWCPASVAHFVGEPELNPSRVGVGDLTRRDAEAKADAQHNDFEWAACSTRTGDLR